MKPLFALLILILLAQYAIADDMSTGVTNPGEVHYATCSFPVEISNSLGKIERIITGKMDIFLTDYGPIESSLRFTFDLQNGQSGQFAEKNHIRKAQLNSEIIILPPSSSLGPFQGMDTPPVNTIAVYLKDERNKLSGLFRFNMWRSFSLSCEKLTTEH